MLFLFLFNLKLKVIGLQVQLSDIFLCLQQQQRRMMEVELGAHTIKSHGGRLAWDHKHDWLILLLLIVIEIILFIIHPFRRFVGKDMMTDLRYPLKDNTVPVWAVPVSFYFV